jgi:hypothetical protein
MPDHPVGQVLDERVVTDRPDPHPPFSASAHAAVVVPRVKDGVMIGRLDLLALDAPDIERLAEFYADLTGWKRHVEEPDWITLINGAGQKLSFQLAPDHVPPQWPSAEHPQQVHLDLLTSDVEAVAEQAVRLGATRLGGGETWQTLADRPGTRSTCATGTTAGTRWASTR